MHDYRKTVKATLYMIYIAIFLLAVFTVFMPFLVRWFVEVRQKNPNLATSIMITCYPCVPFATAMLFSLRALLKNVLSGLILGDKNNTYLKIVALCCLCAAVITFIGGFRYMPFWIISCAAAIGALIIWTVRCVFDTALQLEREKEYKTVRKFYEENDNIGDR